MCLISTLLGAGGFYWMGYHVQGYYGLFFGIWMIRFTVVGASLIASQNVFNVHFSGESIRGSVVGVVFALSSIGGGTFMTVLQLWFADKTHIPGAYRTYFSFCCWMHIFITMPIILLCARDVKGTNTRNQGSGGGIGGPTTMSGKSGKTKSKTSKVGPIEDQKIGNQKIGNQRSQLAALFANLDREEEPVSSDRSPNQPDSGYSEEGESLIKPNRGDLQNIGRGDSQLVHRHNVPEHGGHNGYTPTTRESVMNTLGNMGNHLMTGSSSAGNNAAFMSNPLSKKMGNQPDHTYHYLYQPEEDNHDTRLSEKLDSSGWKPTPADFGGVPHESLALGQGGHVASSNVANSKLMVVNQYQISNNKIGHNNVNNNPNDRISHASSGHTGLNRYNQKDHHNNQDDSQKALKQALRNPVFWTIFLSLFCFAMCRVIFQFHTELMFSKVTLESGLIFQEWAMFNMILSIAEGMSQIVTGALHSKSRGKGLFSSRNFFIFALSCEVICWVCYFSLICNYNREVSITSHSMFAPDLVGNKWHARIFIATIAILDGTGSGATNIMNDLAWAENFDNSINGKLQAAGNNAFTIGASVGPFLFISLLSWGGEEKDSSSVGPKKENVMTSKNAAPQKDIEIASKRKLEDPSSSGGAAPAGGHGGGEAHKFPVMSLELVTLFFMSWLIALLVWNIFFIKKERWKTSLERPSETGRVSRPSMGGVV